MVMLGQPICKARPCDYHVAGWRLWNDEWLRGFHVVVNLSAREFETNVREMLRELDALGLNISMDAFGAF